MTDLLGRVDSRGGAPVGGGVAVGGGIARHDGSCDKESQESGVRSQESGDKECQEGFLYMSLKFTSNFF